MKIPADAAFVDSIDKETARLLISAAALPVEMPRILLPEDISSGDWLSVTFKKVRGAKRKNLDEINDLLKNLGNRP